MLKNENKNENEEDLKYESEFWNLYFKELSIAITEELAQLGEQNK